jgi:hypothetical protein
VAQRVQDLRVLLSVVHQVTTQLLLVEVVAAV